MFKVENAVDQIYHNIGTVTPLFKNHFWDPRLIRLSRQYIYHYTLYMDICYLDCISRWSSIKYFLSPETIECFSKDNVMFC